MSENYNRHTNETIKYGAEELKKDQESQFLKSQEESKNKGLVAEKINLLLENNKGQELSLEHLKLQLLQSLSENDESVDCEKVQDENNWKYIQHVGVALGELAANGKISKTETKGVIKVEDEDDIKMDQSNSLKA